VYKRQAIFRTEEDRIVREIPFDSYETKEIGVVVTDKPQYVEIDPVFAKNWTNPRFNYDIPEKPANAAPFEGIKTVEPFKSSEIIVDDQDEGFSIASVKKDRFRIFGQKTNGSNIREGIGSIAEVFSRLGSWTRLSFAGAYGKYRNSVVVKNKGKGSSYASWKTVIPEDGIYDTYIFIKDYTYNRRIMVEIIGTMFYVTVISSGEEDNIELKTSRNMDGWHYLGEYEYKKNETAEIRLSDKCDEIVIADAVKWIPAKQVKNHLSTKTH